ncbi:MAG TPA: GAF domain-containing protein [Polyangiaceae bacterium]|nr:GAF domain-containing protein [Polyangiaceae bacterium]
MSNLSDRITKARAKRGGRGNDWYVTNGSKVVGPVNTNLLLRGIAHGRVSRECFVAQYAWSNWRQQNHIREIRSLRRWQFSQAKNPTIEPVAQALRGPSVDPAVLAGIQQGEQLLQKALEIAVQTTRASVGVVHRPLPPHIGLVTSCVHGPGLRQNLGEVVPWNDDARLVAHGDDALLGQPDQDDWARCSARRLSTVAHPRVSGVAVVPVSFGETRGLIELGRYDHAFRQTDLDVLEELSDSIVERLQGLCD